MDVVGGMADAVPTTAAQFDRPNRRAIPGPGPHVPGPPHEV